MVVLNPNNSFPGFSSSFNQLSENAITISPNPASQFIRIEVDAGTSERESETIVRNLDGRILYRGIIPPGEREFLIYLTQKFTSGMYLVQLVQDGSIIYTDRTTVVR